MKPFCNPLLPCLALCAIMSAPLAAAQEAPAKLSGRTRAYAMGSYRPLANVGISVYRRIGFVKHDYSDASGDFSIDVPSGPPFLVLFIGPDGYLPELQSLAGEPNAANNLVVCLMTGDELRRQGISPFKHVEAVIDRLEADGVPPDDEALKSLRVLLRRLG